MLFFDGTENWKEMRKYDFYGKVKRKFFCSPPQYILNVIWLNERWLHCIVAVIELPLLLFVKLIDGIIIPRYKSWQAIMLIILHQSTVIDINDRWGRVSSETSYKNKGDDDKVTII